MLQCIFNRLQSNCTLKEWRNESQCPLQIVLYLHILNRKVALASVIDMPVVTDSYLAWLFFTHTTRGLQITNYKLDTFIYFLFAVIVTIIIVLCISYAGVQF